MKHHDGNKPGYGFLVVLAGLFLAVVWLLYRFDVWTKIGVEVPHGIEIQGLLFLALAAILQRTLFLPYLDVLDERDRETVKKKALAENTRDEADRMIAGYRKSIEDARLRATTERERVAIDAEAEERKKLAQAKEAAAKRLAESVRQISTEAEGARQGLKGEIDRLAMEIAEKVVTPKSAKSFRRTGGTELSA